MKKRSNAARLGVLVLALTLITTCLVGGTLARYVTEVDGSAKAVVAKWAFDAKNSNQTIATQNFVIDLGDTTNRSTYPTTDIKEGVVAPGTTGSFDIVLDGTGSEVGIDYTVKFAAKENSPAMPDDMVFSFKPITESNKGVKLASLADETGTIDYTATAKGMEKTITVYWSWAFDENDTKDSNDNTYKGVTWLMDITVTGKQTAPEISTAP